MKLIADAQQAVDEGAAIDDPRIRALASRVTMAYDLDTYRRGRRGLGLSKRQARERVEQVTTFSYVATGRGRERVG